MKHFFCIAIAVFLLSCTKPPAEKIKGTWETFAYNYGFTEMTFNDDKTVDIRTYSIGDESDEPGAYWREGYTFVDDILFIEPYAYYYMLADNKLFLSGEDRTVIYARKTGEKSIEEKRKILTGHWECPNFEMVFNEDNTVLINEFDENGNIIANNTYPFELTGRAITLKEIDKGNTFSAYMNHEVLELGKYLYKINNTELFLVSYDKFPGLVRNIVLEKKR